MTSESVDRADDKEARSRAVKRHAFMLFGVAAGIFVTYIVYVIAYTMNYTSG